MSNKEIILDQFEKHKGEIVITTSQEILRWIAVCETNYDYFYILSDGLNITLSSCVGRLIFINGKIDEKDYEYLSEHKKYQLSKNKLSEIIKDKFTDNENYKLLTEINNGT